MIEFPTRQLLHAHARRRVPVRDGPLYRRSSTESREHRGMHVERVQGLEHGEDLVGDHVPKRRGNEEVRRIARVERRLGLCTSLVIATALIWDARASPPALDLTDGSSRSTRPWRMLPAWLPNRMSSRRGAALYTHGRSVP